MLHTTLAVAVLSASSIVSPFANLLHMHPRTAPADSRVVIVLENNSSRFIDFKVAGQTYTVDAHSSAQVKAPAGTVLYAGSTTYTLRPGQQIAELTPEMNHASIVVR